MADRIDQARRWYAEELRFTAHVRSHSVIEAFAAVPREHFVGAGPWRIRSPGWRLGPGEDYWTAANKDPRHVYHDVLIALDEARGINNGQPSLWAGLFDQLDIRRGERVIHLGCGTGYYTAIAAELVDADGRITAVEVNPKLATRARTALAPWPQAAVLNTDGSSISLDPTDAIMASAGATHPLPACPQAARPASPLHDGCGSMGRHAAGHSIVRRRLRSPVPAPGRIHRVPRRSRPGDRPSPRSGVQA